MPPPLPSLRLRPLRYASAALRLRTPPRRFGTTCISRRPDNAGTIKAQALAISSFGDPEDVLRLVPHKIELESPQMDGVLLRTLAAPVNPADVNVIQGTYGTLPRFMKSPFGPAVESVDPAAAVPGNEGVFEVIATGINVTNGEFALGDWVIPLSPGYGTWRTHVLTTKRDASLWKIPGYIREKGLLPVQAATVAVNPLTALKLVEEFGCRWDHEARQEVRGLRKGDWLVQNGANSTVGRLVIQLAKMKGINTLNVVRERETHYETESLRQELHGLGANMVATESQLGRELHQKLMKESDGKGASLMLDCVGGRAASSLAKILNPGAEVVTYGAMSKKGLILGAGMLIFKDIRLRGFWVSRWGKEFPEKKKEALESLLNMMVEGRLSIPHPDIVPWAGSEMRLIKAVSGTLEGFKKGKLIFEFPPEGELPDPVLAKDISRGVFLETDST